MKSIPHLYVSEETAKELGCTHEARLFGVPGYSFDSPDDSGSFEFVPKIYPLTLYLQAADWFYDFASAFVPDGIETPYTVVRKL